MNTFTAPAAAGQAEHPIAISGYSAIVAMDPPQECHGAVRHDGEALSCVMNPPTADMLHFAMDYARRGWPVFPCNPINKQPLTKHGFKDASTDPEQIKQWWTKWPLAMIGVPMGAASGVVAIDPDAPKDDNDQDGRRNWALLLAQHGGVYTHTHLTPRGGNHVLFRYDPERPLGNSEGGLEGKNINVRGDGGYIIVPPSQRGDGKRYDIADMLDFFNFARMPEWLHEILDQKSEPATQPSISKRAAEQMYAQRSVNGPDTGGGDTFFTRVNSAALRNLSAWVPSIFPQAEFQPGTGAYRISSESLGRDLEEDLSVSPQGIKDWGVWDMGDPRRGKRTPIDVVIEFGAHHDPREAAFWLCERMGVSPSSLGWDAPPIKEAALGAAQEQQPADTDLGVWDAGDDTAPIPPRGWLLGNTYCRRFLSSLVGDGGVGKTAVRYAQLLSAAIGRSLTGEHVFVRSRVLIISLEDDDTELRRRIRAACLHYGISQAALRGWLFLSAPGQRRQAQDSR